MTIPVSLTLSAQRGVLKSLLGRKLNRVLRVIPQNVLSSSLGNLDEDVDGPYILEFSDVPRLYFYAYPDDQGDHLLVSEGPDKSYNLTDTVEIDSAASPAWDNCVNFSLIGINILSDHKIEAGVAFTFTNNVVVYLYDLNDDLCSSRDYPFDREYSSNISITL